MTLAHQNDSADIGGITNRQLCTADRNWNELTKSLRRLGLLLLEITFGTFVVKLRTDTTGSITHISLRVDGEPHNGQDISLDNAMILLGNAVHGSDGFSDAVRCCLTRILYPVPTDSEWDELLGELYFDIVKP